MEEALPLRYEQICGSSCPGGGSWRATTAPPASQRVIALSGSCATKALYSLQAMASLRSAMEFVGFWETVMLPLRWWRTGSAVV
jgi:hypothetical protein